MRVVGGFLGLAYSVLGVAASVRRAGLELELEEVARSLLVVWGGAGPADWGCGHAGLS